MTEASTGAGQRAALRVLLLRLAVFVLLVGSADSFVRRYAERRFVPFVRLHEAVAAGEGCVLITGGSDMESAIDAPALAAIVGGQGSFPCVADLAIGGTHKDARFMAVREYLEAGRKPAALVVGFKGYDLAEELEETPGYYVGSNAAVYSWGRLADISTYFPELTFTAADNAFRFLLFRGTALGAFRQALWERVNAVEERLGLREQNPMNRFGYVKEFLALDEAKRRAALAHRRGAAEPWVLARFNARLVEAVVRAGARSVYFVRLPALAATERAYFADERSEDIFNHFMQENAQRHHGKYVDLSQAAWMQDTLLLDGLHYSPVAAAHITAAVGDALGVAR